MKYFCVSDIHGYYDQLIEALNTAGYKPDNPNHMLIACGDHFDRGRQPKEVLDYLSQLPRKILIWGNHDTLLLKSCKRGWFYDYDRSNGTLGTVHDLSLDFAAQYKAEHGDYPGTQQRCEEVLRIVEPFYQQHVNYYETSHYIFVHAWVPVSVDDQAPVQHIRGRRFAKHPDWRNATPHEWDQSRWVNPYNMAKLRLQAEKVIVCGHWHCSAGWASAEGRSEFDEDACFDPYEGDGFLAIDACTAHTGKVNVVVLEDEPLPDKCDKFCAPKHTAVEKTGDILSPNKTGHDVLVCHQVNCMGVMGAGLAKQLRTKFPSMYQSYKAFCDNAKDRRSLLGGIDIHPVNYNGYDYTIVSIFGQETYGRGKCHTDYQALRKAFQTIRTMAMPLPARPLTRVRIPYRMGCGLAGGDWSIVSSIIQEELLNHDIIVEIWKKD